LQNEYSDACGVVSNEGLVVTHVSVGCIDSKKKKNKHFVIDQLIATQVDRKRHNLGNKKIN